MQADTQKTVQVLNYFARNTPKLTLNKAKALKLMWLADRLHLMLYGRTITYDQYKAMKNGPVASHARDLLEQNQFLSSEQLEYVRRYHQTDGTYDFKSIAPCDEVEFSDSDAAVLRNIREHYGHWSWRKLSDFSHRFPEWAYYQPLLKEQKKADMDPIHFFEPVTIEEASIFRQVSHETLFHSKELFQLF